MQKLNARQLRNTVPSPATIQTIPKNPIYIILDNVLDTYNVGSIFRLADAIAVRKVYLCGQTLTPPNSRIKKASINTWQWVHWQYAEAATGVLSNLRKQIPNLQIIAVEQDKRSKPFYKARYELPLALVVGNETHGISKEILDMADSIVELPMWGVNKSLNVMVSLGFVLYEIMKNTQTAHE